MNGINVADKLGLGSEVRELKFGSSFSSSGGRGQQQGSFHSVRYDFKPASVDTSKMATLDVGPNGQVTISMPNIDGNGTTVFKGARKPYAKECVLIIDNDTGEVVLEKLTHNIQVKRTREEGGSKKGGTMTMPMPSNPPPAAELKKREPPPSFKSDSKISNSSSSSGSGSRDRDDLKKTMPPAPMQHSSQQGSSKRGPTSSHSPKPPHHPQPRQSPNNGPSPGHSTSPPMAFSPSTGAGSSQDSHRQAKQAQTAQQQQPNLLSLTNFEDLLSMPPMNPPLVSKPAVEKPPIKESAAVAMNPPAAKSFSGGVTAKGAPTSALSESSSGEDSSSSSSSDDDDDDSSDMEEVPDKVPIPPIVDISSKAPVLGGSSSSQVRPQPPPPVAPSMPTDLLCDDLQLSESGSDSD